MRISHAIILFHSQPEQLELEKQAFWHEMNTSGDGCGGKHVKTSNGSILQQVTV